MSGDPSDFDFAVIGSGPGGQKAAICAAKAGQSVCVIEEMRELGGACVHYGTIPSKTLRANALRAAELRRSASLLGVAPPEELELSMMLGRVDEVVTRYAGTVGAQLERNGVERIHGRASFVDPHTLRIVSPGGDTREIRARFVVIACGSRPRHPEGVAVDHEHVLDGDSILSLDYLPRSLAVLGGGVIACEYASVFAGLGVNVTLIERGPRPLGFLDEDLSRGFLEAFEAEGGYALLGSTLASIEFDGVSKVEIALEGGARIGAEKVLVALGRTACVDRLGLANAGLAPTERGVLPVEAGGRTEVPHLYAVGDAAGPPALATSAMEQGRRAVEEALGLEVPAWSAMVPTGIYAIPELAAVGMTEADAEEAFGGVAVGRARFDEVARGQVSDLGSGFLKLVADPSGERLVGAHALGEGAAELIHVGQMALFANARIEDLIDQVFNFPTLAEAYRIAALDLRNGLREQKPAQP
ncbi:MAG: Si-specific NAD(P)(+) transhydrogenase [Myxococcales bacterium]|nr:Si-specific NAD(P)(+) transhydrogenase [Myxococcales bacterium]